MSNERHFEIGLDIRVRDCPTKQAGLAWALAVDRRLDQLVALANDAGANTRRNELAAAVVAHAEPKPEFLLSCVLALRRSLVRDVLVDVPAAGNVVRLPRYGPGRRKHPAG